MYDINESGRIILGLEAEEADYSRYSVCPAGADSGKEYIISRGNRKHRVVADIYKVGMDPYDSLMLFGDAVLRTETSDDLLRLNPSEDLDRIIGKSPAILLLKKNIRLVAPSTSNILITGESGTGKELVARAVHGESPRKKKPFVAVNCAALPENLLESELFGYVKGAFTGASAGGKKGIIETAQGGTFFMDEIGDMPLSIQAKLLRTLEQREITRLGSNIPIPIDVRFVFATNRDLEKMVSEGSFRQDLYYRINVVPLQIPPLRERQGDVRLIAERFIRRFIVSLNRPCSGITDDFWEVLENYSWPGNVRELQNVIEYAVNMLPSSGVLRSELLQKRLPSAGMATKASTASASMALPDIDSGLSIQRMEELMIRHCLDEFGDKKDGKRMAAGKLGISLATLYRKMKEYGIGSS